METTQANQEKFTFEKVWEMFQESKKETDRMFQESKKVNDRIIGKLGNRFGELVEHLVAPNLMEKFNELGYSFTESSMDVIIIEPDNPDTSTDIDILLENGDIVIAIEVKSKPNDEDVRDHIQRMEVLRRRADRRNDTRKYRGAIAGAIMSPSVRQYITKNGFYLIEQTGDTVKINIPEKFKAREW